MGSAAGRIVLVTGSTDGLGLATARRLAALGACVLVHGRNPQKLERVLSGVSSGGESGPHGYLADLSSLEETRRLARDITAEHERLDVLVNNAGVVSLDRQLSRDGIELGFAVNYLSHFLLTLELLPLIEAGGGRVVNVASIGQHAIDFDDVMLERDYSASRSYSQSKLAQIMFTIELAERLGPEAAATVNALHPATLMDTKMVRGFGGRVLSTVAEGTEATVRLAAGDELDGVTGRYFDGLEEATADPQAYDADARRRLWELSEELTGARLRRGDLRFTHLGRSINERPKEVEVSEVLVHTTIESPVGDLMLIGDRERLLGLHMQAGRRPGHVPADSQTASEPFAAAREQLGEYFAGERTDFDLPLAPLGTPFQEEVWSALRGIPYGETASYGELAERIGRPSGSRAVGMANGRNPISIVVPCHRVIGATGELTGYAGGVERKRFLLELERGA